MDHVNIIRKRHGVDSLQWSSETTKRARDLLDHMEATQSSSYSAAAANLEFGDNLSFGLDGSVDPTTACIQAFDIWQAEGSDYDFGNAGYSKTTSNFAAVVYKATTHHVGFAIHWNGLETGYNVAAAFSPRGKTHRGDFRRNVFPPLLPIRACTSSAKRGRRGEPEPQLRRRACVESDSRSTFSEDGHQYDGLESSTHTTTRLRNLQFFLDLYR